MTCMRLPFATNSHHILASKVGDLNGDGTPDVCCWFSTRLRPVTKSFVRERNATC